MTPHRDNKPAQRSGKNGSGKRHAQRPPTSITEPESGVIYSVSEFGRRYRVEERALDGRPFTDAVSVPDFKPRALQVALVCIEPGEVRFVALARKGQRVATEKVRLSFSNFVELDPHLPLEEIRNSMPPELRRHLDAFGQGRRIAPASWAAAIEAVKLLRPEVAAQISNIQQLASKVSRRFTGPGAPIISQERDAINLALRIAGFNPEVLLDWEPPPSGGAPFLRGLGPVRLREDAMVIHDHSVFGDWTQIQQYAVGTAEFRDEDGRRLYITNVNRTPIEETLGVDLIYYFPDYRSYLLVQYKRMRNEGNEAVFRPDSKVRQELERMTTFTSRFPASDDPKHDSEYRLHPHGFYLKLCPEDFADANSPAMIPGMYLPLDFWQTLERSGALAGPKGGTVASFSTVPRHLDNTHFVHLAQAGWIGTRDLQSDALTEVIRLSLESGKSVLLATLDPTTVSRARPKRRRRFR